MLKREGIENIVMLTGDSVKAAEIIAAKLGITEVHAQVLPEQKHGMIEELKAQGRRVIMVGDGINDAPALAAANVFRSHERRFRYRKGNCRYNSLVVQTLHSLRP